MYASAMGVRSWCSRSLINDGRYLSGWIWFRKILEEEEDPDEEMEEAEAAEEGDSKVCGGSLWPLKRRFRSSLAPFAKLKWCIIMWTKKRNGMLHRINEIKSRKSNARPLLSPSTHLVLIKTAA